MAHETLPIARIVLARDVRRILTLPLLLAVTGLSAALAGLLLGGTAELIAVVGGGVAIAGAVLLAIVPLSVRMDVEVGGLRTRWLGGTRRYQLARGPVTRVALTGPSAGSIRSRFPVLGWSFGRAVLRGQEPIVLVRLARTPNVIVVPTNEGRLAIAAASEGDLIDALGAAARVQQRLDEVGGRVLAAFPEGLAALEEPPPARPIEKERKPKEDAERFLTGIERAQLEARLAAARQAALLAAEAERRATLAAQDGRGGDKRGGRGRTPGGRRGAACRLPPRPGAACGDLDATRLGDRCARTHSRDDQLGACAARRFAGGLGVGRSQPANDRRRRNLVAPGRVGPDARRARCGAWGGGCPSMVAKAHGPHSRRGACIVGADRSSRDALN